MNETITYRADEKTKQNLKWLKEKLNISQSDINRMAIQHLANYVKKVSK